MDGHAPAVRTFEMDNNAFAIELYGQLRNQSGNLFFSPESISTALAMTYAGARAETAAEMATILHFALPPDRLHRAMGTLLRDRNAVHDGYQLKETDALWVQTGYLLLPEFPWPQDDSRIVADVFREEQPRLLPLPTQPLQRFGGSDDRAEAMVGPSTQISVHICMPIWYYASHEKNRDVPEGRATQETASHFNQNRCASRGANSARHRCLPERTVMTECEKRDSNPGTSTSVGAGGCSDIATLYPKTVILCADKWLDRLSQ